MARDGTAWLPSASALTRSGRRTGAAQCAALAGSEGKTTGAVDFASEGDGA